MKNARTTIKISLLTRKFHGSVKRARRVSLVIRRNSLTKITASRECDNSDRRAPTDWPVRVSRFRGCSITGYSPERRHRLQSVIQILGRAGSVSLSRARHVSWNVEQQQQQQPGSDDQRHVRHFHGWRCCLRRRRRRSRCRLSRLVETRKLFNDPTSRVSLVRPSHDQSTKSHARKRSFFGVFLSLERFQRRLAIDTTIGSTIMVLDRLDT